MAPPPSPGPPARQATTHIHTHHASDPTLPKQQGATALPNQRSPRPSHAHHPDDEIVNDKGRNTTVTTVTGESTRLAARVGAGRAGNGLNVHPTGDACVGAFGVQLQHQVEPPPARPPAPCHPPATSTTLGNGQGRAGPPALRLLLYM